LGEAMKLQRYAILFTGTHFTFKEFEHGIVVQASDAEKLEKRVAELEDALREIDNRLTKADVPCFCTDHLCFSCIAKKALKELEAKNET
jgi:hypothetical protein